MPDMVFLAVVETGSFAAAGRRLRRATSAVSYTIANLETQLGIALFDRERTRKRDSRLITGKKTADPAARAGGRLVRWARDAVHGATIRAAGPNRRLWSLLGNAILPSPQGAGLSGGKFCKIKATKSSGLLALPHLSAF